MKGQNSEEGFQEVVCTLIGPVSGCVGINVKHHFDAEFSA